MALTELTSIMKISTLSVLALLLIGWSSSHRLYATNCLPDNSLFPMRLLLHGMRLSWDWPFSFLFLVFRFSPSLQAPYLDVHNKVGSLIDFYNIQFYNRECYTFIPSNHPQSNRPTKEGSAYTTCPGLLNSSPEFPGSSIFEMSQAGVPLDKIVLGKPALTSDASTGFVDVQTLAQCVSQGAGQGWNGGVMVWQYPHADSSWIQTVRGSTFPL